MSPVTGPSCWTRDEFAARSDWTFQFPAGSAEAEYLLEAGTAFGSERTPDRVSNWVLPSAPESLTRVLNSAKNSLLRGSGVSLIRGFPVQGYTPEQLRTMLLALGRLMGRPISQNSFGDLIGDVRDDGKRYRTTGDTRGARGYRSNESLLFHSDLGDLVGLLCIHKAQEGGHSSVSSSMALYNAALTQHPEYLPVYYRGFPCLNIEEGGGHAHERLPVFSYHDGILSCAIRRNAIETAKLNGVEFTDLELKALQFFDDTASNPQLRFDMVLEPGDIQFLHNYSTLHSRTEFHDPPESTQRRHLLRLWLQVPEGRPFLRRYPSIYDGIAVTLSRPAASSPAV